MQLTWFWTCNERLCFATAQVFYTKIAHTTIYYTYKFKCYVNVYGIEMCVSMFVCFSFTFYFSICFSLCRSLARSHSDIVLVFSAQNIWYSLFLWIHTFRFSRFTRYPISFEQKSMHQHSFVYTHINTAASAYIGVYARMHAYMYKQFFKRSMMIFIDEI